MKKIIYLIAAICSFQSFGQTYNGTGGPLPDVSTSDFTVNVSGLSPAALNNVHGLVQVCLDLNHTYVSDLNISLISPSGNIIVLVNHVGGGGQDFIGTCLNDASTNAIAMGSAPFTGTYSPSENIGSLNDGTNGNGIWTLSIRDDAGADTGFLNNWSIHFDTGAPVPFMLSSSNLPIVIINTLGQTIVDEPKINCTMKIINNAPGIRNWVTDLPEYDAEIGIEIRGNYSSSLPQKPYAFSTQDIAHNDSNVSLVGLPSEHDWILQATYNDKTLMRNQMMFDLAREMGHYAPRTVNCEVIINNQYKGVYFICEKIKRDSARVDIARLDADDNAGDSLTGGYIFKHDYDADGWDSYWRDTACPTRPLHYNYYYPSSANITTPQADYIKNYVDSFEVALFSDHFQDSTWGYKRFISQKTFVDYLILNDLAANGDGYKKSMFFSKDKNGKLKAGPIWDFDWALKFAPWMDSSMSGNFYAQNPCDGDVLITPWYARLMQDTSFSNAVYCRWTELRENLLIDTSHLFHYIDTTSAYMNESQARHFDKWRILGLDSGSPEVYPIPISYTEELNRYKFFFERRIAWMDENIVGNCYVAPVDSTNDTLGLHNYAFSKAEIAVFPNPAKDLINIVTTAPISIKQVKITNLLGSEVKLDAQLNNATQYQMSIADLPGGNYIIEIMDGQGQHHRLKLFKE